MQGYISVHCKVLGIYWCTDINGIAVIWKYVCNFIGIRRLSASVEHCFLFILALGSRIYCHHVHHLQHIFVNYVTTAEHFVANIFSLLNLKHLWAKEFEVLHISGAILWTECMNVCIHVCIISKSIKNSKLVSTKIMVLVHPYKTHDIIWCSSSNNYEHIHVMGIWYTGKLITQPCVPITEPFTGCGIHFINNHKATILKHTDIITQAALYASTHYLHCVQGKLIFTSKLWDENICA